MKFALLSIAVVLVILFVIVRVLKGGVYGLFTKTLASIGFVALALVGALKCGYDTVAMFICLGLIFGMIGDIVLDLKVIYKNDMSPYLNVGMLSFGIGHLMYMIATILYAGTFLSTNRILALGLIAIGVAGFLTVLIVSVGAPILKLDFGKFKIQTILYTIILTFMSAFSVAVSVYKPIFLIFALGIVFIFLSDLVLSNQYFGGKQDSKLLTIINHLVYYFGQIAIAFSLFYI